MPFKIDHTPWAVVTAADAAGGYLRGAVDEQRRRETAAQQYANMGYTQDREDARQQNSIAARAAEAEKARQAKALEDGDLASFVGDAYGQLDQIAPPDAANPSAAPNDYLSVALGAAKKPRQLPVAVAIAKRYDARDAAAKKATEANLKASAEKQRRDELAKAYGLDGSAAGAAPPAAGTPVGDGAMDPQPLQQETSPIDSAPPSPSGLSGVNYQNLKPGDIAALANHDRRVKMDEERLKANVGRRISADEMPLAQKFLAVLRDSDAPEEDKDAARLWLRARDALPVSAMVESTRNQPDKDPTVRIAYKQYEDTLSAVKQYRRDLSNPMMKMLYERQGITEQSLLAATERAKEAYLAAHAVVVGHSHRSLAHTPPLSPVATASAPVSTSADAQLRDLLGP